MKKLILFIVAILLLIQLNSCTPYRSIENANTISQLAGNKHMKNLSRDVIHQIWVLSTQMGTEKSIRNRIQLNTNLRSVIPADLLGSFSNLLSKQYHIPLMLLEKNMESWQTVRDVIAFVGKNGSGFQFYKQ